MRGKVRWLPWAVLAAACASAPPGPPPAVPVGAARGELARLAGEWWGEYSSAETGRSGRIRFSVEAGTGEALGDVLMIPYTVEGWVGREGEAAGPPAAREPGRTLAIRFVSIREGLVTGTLEPYPDPDCQCLLSTSFTGEVRGDVIEGEFVSVAGGGHPTETGRWRVERQGRGP